MRLTVLAVRRNSPSSGRPSMSSAIDCDKIALGDGADHAGHFARRMHQVADQRVDRVDRAGPRAAAIRPAEARCLILPFFADDAADAIELVGHAFELVHHLVKGVADFAAQADPGRRQPHRKIAAPQRRQRTDQRLQIHFIAVGRGLSIRGNIAIRDDILVVHGSHKRFP